MAPRLLPLLLAVTLLTLPVGVFAATDNSYSNSAGNSLNNSVGNALGNSAGNSATNSAGNFLTNSLPDSWWYPVKLFIEQAGDMLTFDQATLAQRHFDHAQVRLEEAQVLKDEIAQQTPAAQTPNTVAAFERSVSQMTLQEMASSSAHILAQMGPFKSGAERLLQRAREVRDVVQALCLNDKLSQMDVAIKAAQDRVGNLSAAVQRGDKEQAAHEYRLIFVLAGRVRESGDEANRCIGQDSAVTESGVTIISPLISPFDDSTSTIDGAFAEPTNYPPTDVTQGQHQLYALYASTIDSASKQLSLANFPLSQPRRMTMIDSWAVLLDDSGSVAASAPADVRSQLDTLQQAAKMERDYALKDLASVDASATLAIYHQDLQKDTANMKAYAESKALCDDAWAAVVDSDLCGARIPPRPAQDTDKVLSDAVNIISKAGSTTALARDWGKTIFQDVDQYAGTYLSSGGAGEKRDASTTLRTLQFFDDAQKEIVIHSPNIPIDMSIKGGTPTTTKKYQSQPSDWKDSCSSGWNCLKFNMDRPQYFVYEYVASSSGFSLHAWGDLNGDDSTSTFTMPGQVDQGQAHIAPVMSETDPDDGLGNEPPPPARLVPTPSQYSNYAPPRPTSSATQKYIMPTPVQTPPTTYPVDIPYYRPTSTSPGSNPLSVTSQPPQTATQYPPTFSATYTSPYTPTYSPTYLPPATPTSSVYYPPPPVYTPPSPPPSYTPPPPPSYTPPYQSYTPPSSTQPPYYPAGY